MKKKGSYRIILKRLLVAVLIIVMLFELSVTPNAPLASIYAKALETAAAIETSTEAPVFEPLDEADLAATQDATVAEAVGEGEGQPDEAALGAANEGEQPADAAVAGDGQAQTGDAAAAAPSEAPQAADAAAGAPSEGTQPAEAAGAGDAQAQPADAAAGTPSTEAQPAQPAEAASTASENPDAATNGASTETAADAASTASSAEVLPADAAASASSGEVKPEDAAASASSGASLPEEAATSASSGASLPDDAATSASSGEKKEEEEKPEGIEGELYAEEGILKLTFGKDAGIPEGCEVAAYEVTSENEGYESYVNKALEKTELASESIASLKVLDISVRKDDEEIQPEDSVNIEMSAAALFGEGALYSDDEVRVVHINGEDGDVLECEVISGEDEEGTDATTQKAEGIRFSTGSFSPFVVMHLVSEKSVKATDDASYEVVASYDNTSGIPAGTELKVNEIWQDGEQMAAYWQQSAALLDEAVYSLEAIRAFDISFVDRETGDVYQPGKDINVSIKLLSNGIIEGAEPKLVRFGEQAEIIDTGFEDQCVSFGTSSLTVYGISQFAVNKTLTAGDGSSYLVTVNYDSVSGIPEGAVLSVSEITENDENFDDYAEKSSEQLEESGPVEVVRAFDISIRNPETGEEYQPTKPIQVSIDIFDENLEDRSEDLDIVHIHGENEEQTDVVESAVNDGVVEFETEGFSVYVVVRKVIEQVLTASDGKEYQITVSFDSTCGIPENAELVVSEIKEGNEGYDRYVSESAEKLDVLVRNVVLAKAFDISLRNPETGEEYQPTKDVKVSIKLLAENWTEEWTEESKLGVVHFGEETEVVDATINEEFVEFETDGFSVYVIIVDEGGKILKPQVEFHFLSDASTEDSENPGVYTASPYSFVNKGGTMQNSEIVISGESLELITNPPNKQIDNGDGTFSYKYFFGWYLVNDSATTAEGVTTYTWEAEPERILFEKTVTIDPAKVVWANDDHTAITSFVWELNGVEHTVKTSDNTGTRTVLDEYGCAHVYLAPIYEDYYFVNFHVGAYGSSLGGSILCRRMVVLGEDGGAEIRIGDVQTSSANAERSIFTGWEGTLWNGTEYAQLRSITLDDVGDELNSGPDKDGYYITVTSKDLYPGRQSVDLYPIFTEARWLHFVTGRTHNGATYVGDKYVYTTENTAEINNGTARFFLTDLPTTKRTGYTFKGWFINPTEQDANGDYIDGIQIADENGRILNIDYTEYDTNGDPVYILKGGRLYAFKELPLSGITLYAHWEEVTNTPIQVIIWQQKVSDNKNNYDYQKSYDFLSSYTVDANSGMTLEDLRVNNKFIDGTTNYEAMNYTGFHYRTTEMNSPRVHGDGSTVVNIYYDRDLMTLYFYYSGNTGDEAYNYTATTSNATTPAQYGIVEGQYVELTPVTGSGTKYTFRYEYQRTTSDTITPQYALVVNGTYKTYEELTREVNTVTTTRWVFQTGSGFSRTNRYMDQGITDGKFYTRSGGRNYVDSGYTVDNPPPENSGTTYYCYYNYRHYELTPQTTTTTTFTWKLNDTTWTGERYRRMAGTAEYTAAPYTIPGKGTQNYGTDSRGGSVELDGSPVPTVTWYASTHVDNYSLDNSNTGLDRDVYGLVDGTYVQLTPVLGSEVTYSTVNSYTETNESNTSRPEQYGLVNGEYVQLSWEIVETTVTYPIQYVYTPSTSTSSGEYYIYRNNNWSNTQLYYNNGRWYRNYSWWTYSDEWTGERYTRSNGSGNYNGTIYGVNQNGITNYSSGTRYGDGGNGVIYQLGNQTSQNVYDWVYNGTRYTSKRYLKGAGATWNGSVYTRTGDAAPYTYTLFEGTPTAGAVLYAIDSNQNGAGNNGHVKINWTTNVIKYTYEDNGGNVYDYIGDRYTYNYGTVTTEYTGTRYLRESASGSYSRMLTYTGLYEQTLVQAGYTWPAQINGTNYLWYEGQNSSGSRLTFLDAFLFADLGYATDNNTVLKLYGTSSSQSQTYIYFYKQNLDGTYPATGLANATNAIATSSGGTFTFTNKYGGFSLDTYSTNGTNWSTANVNGSSQVGYNGLHIRFKRNSYDLIFEPNYPTAAGTTIEGVEVTLSNIENFKDANRVTFSVKYDAPLSTYSSQPKPAQAPDNYRFDGWYVDETCTVKYTFSENMPAANMRLFAKWSPVKYRIKIDPNGGTIDHVNYTRANAGNYTYQEDSNSPTITLSLGEYGSNDNKTGYNSSASTYFNATYGELIEEYNLDRNYVPISDVAAALMDPSDVYYYVNTQYLEGYDLESDLRNAVYVIASELDDYYEFYRMWVQYKADLGLSEEPMGWEGWRDTYVTKNSTGGMQAYRKTTGTEHYTFIGWYKIGANGEPESMPYNFSDPVSEPLTLRAYWRLDATYQILYTAEFTTDEGVLINGEMPYWTDPEDQTSKYSDEAATHIYRQPTGITANFQPTSEYIFRGWRLVNVSTNAQGQTVYTPIEDNVFYDPGDPFTIKAEYADATSVIHMQAYYEKKDSSYRRPYITNMTLNANGGFLTLDGSTELNVNTDLSSTWNGGVGTVMATVNDSGIDTEIIRFGDIQSNTDIHLYRYATDLTHVDGDSFKAELSPAGKNYFKHPDSYFLLGFDDESNEGDYVATYQADSAIGVQRNENHTIYAVWEPMVYIKVVNATGVGDVTFGLSSSEGALQVVNAREGLFKRTPMSAASLSAITVADNDYVWLAVPYGVVKQIVNGQETTVSRHITISGTNSLGAGYLLTATSQLDGVSRNTMTGSITGTNADYISVKNQKQFGFNEELVIHPEGIVITFTAVLNPHTLVLDDNYPTTGVRTEEVYFDKENAENIYGYNVVYGQEKSLYYDLPTTSTRIGYVFLGWDADPNWLANHPNYKDTGDRPTYSTGSGLGWRISSLTDFFKNAGNPSELDNVKTLYAVWDNSATARIVNVYKEVPDPGDKNKEFSFTVKLEGTYRFQYKRNSYSSTSYSSDQQIPTLSQTVALKHGQHIVVTSSQDTVNGGLHIKIDKYNAGSDTPASTYNLDWTWTISSGYNNYNMVKFADFRSLSYSVTEGDYSAAPNYYDTSMTRTAMAYTEYPLKLGESTDVTTLPLTVEGRTVTWSNTEAGGTVVFNNERQTADVTVKKTVENQSGLAEVFNFTASYILDGVTTGLGNFSVTSGSTGHKLKDIPVGAVLTVREIGRNLNNYTTTVKKGQTNLPVTETTSVSGGVTTYTRSTDYTVANEDVDITFTNVLKYYPVTFYKVDQDGNPGVEAFFTLGSSTGNLGERLYPNQNTGVFYNTQKLYVGTYTLTETFTSENYLSISEPVTLTVSSEGGGKITSNNTDYVKIVQVNNNDPTQGFKVYVYNQRIVKLNIQKVLSDPILNTTKVFTFKVEYEYTLLGKTVTHSENVNVTSGTTKEIKVPVNARLKVTEVLSDTDSTVYDTSIQRVPKTGTADAKKDNKTVYIYSDQTGSDHGKITVANDGDKLIFTNKRKIIEVTVNKLIADYDPLNPDNNYFTFTAKLLNGGIPITNYPIDLMGTPDDESDDQRTSSISAHAGEYVFYLQHNGSKKLSIPIGARLTLQETGVSSTVAHTEDVPLSNYAAEVSAIYNHDSSIYSGGSYTSDTMLYDLNPVPDKALTVTFTNGPGGKDVFFKKTNGFGHEDTTRGGALAGAKFSLYDNPADAETGVATGRVDITVNNVKVQEVESTASFDAVNNCNVEFKVKIGIYYMREVNTVPGYEQNKNIYRVVVGKTVAAQNGITLPAGKEFLIELYKDGAVEEIPDIEKHGIINISKTKRTVILKKVNSAEAPVPGAKFDIHYVDKAKMECEAENYSASSLDNGAFFVGKLPFGYYYLHETQLPSGAAADRWFKLTVTADVVKLEDSTEPD